MNKKGNSNIDDHNHYKEAAKFTPVDEEKRYIPVDQRCSVFGCGRKLSLVEKLCGCRCTRHMNKKTILFTGITEK